MKLSTKYLIEYKGYFSGSYLVMTLTDSHIQIQPLNDENNTGASRIEWS